MSMPSSSELVATRQGSSPDLSSSSTTSRSSRASEPWWARAICGSPRRASSLRRTRQPLGAAAVVDEDDRRAVLAHQLEQLGVDRGPDRAAGDGCARRGRRRPGRRRRRRCPCRRRPVGHVVGVRLAHVLDRHVDLQVERLAHAGVDDRAVAARADEEAADLLERALRGRQADALERRVPPACSSRSSVSARWAPRLVRATAWISSTITALGVGEELARPRGQHQVERLRRRDQDVGRLAQHRLRAPSAACRRCGSPTEMSPPIPLQRGAQVLLDVVGERLQRRDVDEPRPRAGGLGDQPVERPEEGGERLARAGRRRHAARSRRSRSPARPGPEPPSALERAREPVTDLRGERCERIGSHATHERTAWIVSAMSPMDSTCRRGRSAVGALRRSPVAARTTCATRSTTATSSFATRPTSCRKEIDAGRLRVRRSATSCASSSATRAARARTSEREAKELREELEQRAPVAGAHSEPSPRVQTGMRVQRRLALVVAARPAGGRPGQAEHPRPDDRRPDARLDVGHAEDARADRRPRHDLHAQLRQLLALLPVARHALHRPVRAQPRRAQQHACRPAATRAWTRRTGSRCGSRRRGYRTMHVGKFLNGYGRDSPPTDVPPGFDDWNGHGRSVDLQLLRLHRERERRASHATRASTRPTSSPAAPAS